MPPRRRALFGSSLTRTPPADAHVASPPPPPASASSAGAPRKNTKGKSPGLPLGARPDASILGPVAVTVLSDPDPVPFPPEEQEQEPETEAQEKAQEDNAPSCFICAEPMRVHAVHPCNHTTCGRCALRLRALYKQRSCVYCKSQAQTVVFTSEPGRLFASFTPEETSWRDERLGLHFASKSSKENCLELLLFHCSHRQCEFTLPQPSATVAGIHLSAAVGKRGAHGHGALSGWASLKEHVQMTHRRQFCDVCIQHKNIFTFEHPLFTPPQLATHHDSDHRKCEFCNQYHYGPDELYKHMRDTHFQCQMCALFATPDPTPTTTTTSHGDLNDDHHARHRRRAQAEAAHHAALAAAEAQTWYRDYFDLERHFDKKHFLCQDPSCRQQKYVVFSNEIDYNAHRLKEHALSMSAKEKRDALHVEASFGENGNRNGTTNNNNSSSSSSSSSSHHGSSSRARGVTGTSGSRGNRRAGFGGRLTAPPTSAAPSHQEDAQAAAQQAFVGLVTTVLGSAFSSSKLASIQSGLESYRSGEASAQDLVTIVLSVVDSRSRTGEHPDAAIHNDASLIRAMGDLILSTPSHAGPHNTLAAEEKATDLLRAWSAISTTRSAFPALGGGGTNAFSTTGKENKYTSAAGPAATNRRAMGATSRSAAAMDFFPALPAASPSVSVQPAGPAIRSGQKKWGSNMPRPTPSTPPASASLHARNAHIPGTAAHGAEHRKTPVVSPTFSRDPTASTSTTASPATSAAVPMPAARPSAASKPAVQTVVYPASSAPPAKGKARAPSQAAFPGLPQKSASSTADRWDEKLQRTRDKVSGKGGPTVWGQGLSNASSPGPSNPSSSSFSSSYATGPGGIPAIPSSHKKNKNTKGQTVITLGSVRR